MPFFKAAFFTCRARAAVVLSRIMILSADSLCVWCRHGALSQALRVGSCQVMEVSLAQTRHARVFRMQNGPSRCPDVKQSDALSRWLADVQGPAGKIRTERLTSRRHQEAWHLDVADCSHTASGVNSWSHENMNENPQTTPPSEGCGCLSWVKKVLTEISFSLKPQLDI